MLSITQKREEAIADYKLVCKLTNTPIDEGVVKNVSIQYLVRATNFKVKQARQKIINALGLHNPKSEWTMDMADKINKVYTLFDLRVFPTVEEVRYMCEAPMGNSREYRYNKLRDRAFEIL